MENLTERKRELNERAVIYFHVFEGDKGIVALDYYFRDLVK